MARLAFALACACAALAGGCGGGEQGGGGEPGTTVPAARGLRVVADEYSFDPSNVVVEGTGRMRVALDNEGALAHNLRLFRGDRELGGTPTLQGGRTESGSVQLAQGRYRMACTVGDHEQLGMVGELEVR